MESILLAVFVASSVFSLLRLGFFLSDQNANISLSKIATVSIVGLVVLSSLPLMSISVGATSTTSSPAGIQSTLVDDAEDNDISEYSGDTTNFSTISSGALDGSYSVEGTTGGAFKSISSTSGLNSYPAAGDTFSVLVQPTSGARAMVRYATQSETSNPDGYRINLVTDDNTIRFQKRSGGTDTTLRSVNATLNGGTTYNVSVSWASDGNQVVQIVNETSGDAVTSFQSKDSTFTSGGVGFEITSGTTSESAKFDLFVKTGDTSSLAADLSCAGLSGELSGRVTNKKGQPVGGATVKVVAINYSSSAVNSDSDAKQYVRDLVPSPPTNLTEQRNSGFSLTGSSGYMSRQDSHVGLIHSKESLGASQLSILPDNADLSNPLWKGITSQQQLMVTCWDPTTEKGFIGSGIGENEYDTQLPGSHKSDCTVQLTQLAGVDDIGTVSVNINQTSQSNGLDPSTLNYGDVSLPSGWYRVQVEGSDASYVVEVGDPPQAIFSDLKDSQGNLIDSAQQYQNDKGSVFTTKTTRSNANGYYSVNIDDPDLQYVGVQAYKYPGKDVTATNLTLSMIRSDANANSLNSSVYLPSRVYRTGVPNQNLNMEMREVSWAAFGNLSTFQSKWADFLSALENGSFSTLPPALQQRLDNMTSDSLQETFTELDKLRQKNKQLEEQYQEALQDANGGSDVNVNIDPNQASDSELRQRIRALQESMTEIQSTIDSGQPTTSSGSETVSLSFPFDTSLQSENVLVRAHFNNGTSKTLSPDGPYVSINQRLGRGDVVRITDFPLGQGDAAVADFEVDIATSDGTGSASKAVKNPTFSGQIPSLDAVEFSSLRPGPSERVEAELHPEDPSKYQNLTDVSAYGPDGQQLSTTMVTDDRSFEFTTNGTGAHRVELTFTNPGGVEFTEVVYVKAGDQSTEWPASVRAKSGPTGVYALVGDGLENGQIDVKNGGTEVEITAVVPQKADSPTDLHIYTQGLETAPDTTTRVSVVRGEQESSIQKHIPVTVHGPTIGETALVYRNDEPLPRDDGNQYGVVKVKGNQTVYQTITSEQGTVGLRVSADPGIVERVRYWVSSKTPDISLPGMSMFPAGSSTPTPGGLALVGFAAVSRRRFL